MVQKSEMANAATAADGDMPQAFEPALARLEALVGRMERGDLTLEQALGAYEEGVALVRVCQQRLAHAESQVKILQDSLLRPWAGDDVGSTEVADDR